MRESPQGGAGLARFLAAGRGPTPASARCSGVGTRSSIGDTDAQLHCDLARYVKFSKRTAYGCIR